MLGFVSLLLSLASLGAAQQISFAPGTGVRSLWIPYITVTGTPLASIASHNTAANVTVYVVSCPTAQPGCALAPNLTLTEGESTVRYVSSVPSGAAATLECQLTGTTAAVCGGAQNNGGNIIRSTSTLAASQILYQAIDVTQTMNNTSTMPVTVTVAPSSSSTSSTSSSTAGVQTKNGPWAMGGAVGAGLIALAAL